MSYLAQTAKRLAVIVDSAGAVDGAATTDSQLLVLKSRDVLFDTGKYSLKLGAREKLAK